MHHDDSGDLIDRLRQRLSKGLAGRYVLEGESGWGGMALVFRARDLRHTRTVAIKVIRPELTTTSAAKRFLEEVRIAARLQHPHIVPLYDSGEVDGLVFYVMPFIAGETLRDRLDREDRLSVDQALAVTRDVADALACAHEAGIIHRDVKPENVLLSGGHALVTDFGVAVALNGRRQAERSYTDPGMAVGTYCYMSPEQASGRNGVDARADIYALGCMTYEMLTGHTPWGDVQERIYGGATGRAMPAVGREDVSDEVGRALATALAYKASDRFGTIGEFAQALRLSGVPRGVLGPPRRRRPRWMIGAAAAVFVLMVPVVNVLLGAGVDSGRYVVAPCTGDTAGIGAEYCQMVITETFGQWDAVRVVGMIDAGDVLRTEGLDRADTDAWYQVAREVRAGRVIRAQLVRIGDTTYLHARIYDGPRRQPVGEARRAVVAIGGNLRILGFTELAGGLLELGDPREQPGLLGTRSRDAGNAYAAGVAAMGSGQLEDAQRRFAAAAEIDVTFGDALFWQAQLASLLHHESAAYQLAASRAAALRDSLLDPRARRFAGPLAALAARDYAAACEMYRDIAHRDSSATLAWLGLADCISRDSLVIPSEVSPSGWAFRSSWHEAGEALYQGLTREPAFIGPLWGRIGGILIVRENVLRRGNTGQARALHMLAWPDVRSDTAYYEPYPEPEFAAQRVRRPLDDTGLLRANMSLSKGLADEWVRRYPLEAQAHYTAAMLSETSALEHRSVPDLEAALASVHRAVELGLDPDVAGAAEARLLFRLERLDEAVTAAWELVRERPPGRGHSTGSLAALIGRAHLAADLVEGDEAALGSAYPRDLRRLALRLDAFAGIGVPVDSILDQFRQIDHLAATLMTREHWEAFQTERVEYLQLLAYPATGAVREIWEAEPYTPMGHRQRHLVHGRADSVRAALSALHETRRGRGSTASLSPMFAWVEAWQSAQIGDTAAAIGQLDIVLGSIRWTRLVHFHHPADAAGIVKAMILRAELALAVGDLPTARRWARTVFVLWRHAEPEVRRTIVHLEPLVREAPPR